MMNLDDAVRLANRLADSAAAEITPRFRKTIAASLKGDLSPVTEADRAAELAIRTILAAERPDDAIAGEEYGRMEGKSGLTWVIDPIDGTKAFMTGRPTFVTMIALLEGERPIVGLIDQPIVGDRWIGIKGRPTSLNGQDVRTRPCANPGDAVFSTTAPDLFHGQDEQVYRRISSAAGIRTYGGDGYAYALLASGWIDIVLEAGLKLHDFAALVPIVEGAGGVITDWSGNPLDSASTGCVLAAGDPGLHALLLRRI